MVNGLYLYSAFLVFWPLKVLLHYMSHSPIHTHSYTDDRGYHAGYQPAHQEEINHSYTFTHRWRSNRSNLGLSVLPKDTSACGLEEPGIDDHSTSWATAAPYVNGVDEILETPFSIMHPNTPPSPTMTSIINKKKNYHLLDNVNKN